MWYWYWYWYCAFDVVFLTIRLLVIELLARRKVLLGDRLDHHALVASDGLGSLGLRYVLAHIAS